MYIYIHPHTCRPLYTVLAGDSVVLSLSNEANDIQHVALIKRLLVVRMGLRDMSLFPVVQLCLSLESLILSEHRHRVYSHIIIHKHTHHTHER